MKCPGGAWRIHEHSLEGGYFAGYEGLVKCPREYRRAEVFSFVHLAISTGKIKKEKEIVFQLSRL